MVDDALVVNSHVRAFVTDRPPDGNPRRDVLRITVVARVRITGGALVLPGGQPSSLQRSWPWQLVHLRVALLAARCADESVRGFREAHHAERSAS